VLTSSEVTRYGFGFTQDFDSAALELYSIFNYYEADIECQDACGSDDGAIEDFYSVVTGARIKF